MIGSNSPRATRLTPIMTPTGTAVSNARKNAENTRVRLATVCSTSVALAMPSVMPTMNLLYTAVGDGRNSGFTQPKYVIMDQITSNEIAVATLINTLAPAPGA